MTEPVQQRAPGWYRRSVVLALVAVIGVPAANGALWLQQAGPRGADVATSSSDRSGGTPRPSGAPQVQSGASTVPSTAAVLDLLQRRAQAVVSGDRAAWLETIDQQAAGLAQRQGNLFDRLVLLRPVSWTYTLQAPDAQLPASRQAVLGASAFLAHVRLAYRLVAGAGEVERDQHLTLVSEGGRWLVGDDQDGSQQRDLWDLGAISVSRGSRSVVVSAAAAPLPASRTASEADAAARRVDAVWGTAWPRHVVVMVPASLADMATLLDRTSTDGLTQLAAVTTGELRTQGTGDVTGGRTTGDHVVINPAAFPGLTELGRDVVLTHEFTHVATRASARTAPPVWVDEGFADYVAYLGTPLGVREIAADLYDDPATVAKLRDLPSDEDFDPSAGRIGAAYAEAWLAMRFVGQEGGTGMVVDFYRVAVGLPALHTWPTASPLRASLAPRTPLEHACADVAGYLEPSFVRRWLIYVRRPS